MNKNLKKEKEKGLYVYMVIIYENLCYLGLEEGLIRIWYIYYEIISRMS